MQPVYQEEGVPSSGANRSRDHTTRSSRNRYRTRYRLASINVKCRDPRAPACINNSLHPCGRQQERTKKGTLKNDTVSLRSGVTKRKATPDSEFVFIPLYIAPQRTIVFIDPGEISAGVCRRYKYARDGAICFRRLIERGFSPPLSNRVSYFTTRDFAYRYNIKRNLF